MLSILAHSSLEAHCSYSLKFFVAKNHLRRALLLTAVFLAVVLLDHFQHALLKGLSTQRVWHYACAYVLLSDEVESASKIKKPAAGVFLVLVKCRQNVANKLFISRYFNPVVPVHPCAN